MWFRNRRNGSKRDSARDLPSVKKLYSNALSLSWVVSLVGGNEMKTDCKSVIKDLNSFIALIDDFYSLLGKKNWIFINEFNNERIHKIIEMKTPEEAEHELIKYFMEQDILDRMISNLNRFPDMRPRLPLLQKAKKDYMEGRFYSSVLVVISVMDGFTNDVFRSDGRKGMHARKAEEFHTRSAAATLWDGLPSVQKVFTKTIKSRIDEPVFEVYRNGIMHGMITNYDNEIVASKAWCMLSAVCDWVDGELEKQTVEFERTRSLFEIFSDLRRRNQDEKMLSEWRSHKIDLEHPENNDAEFLASCKAYLEAWKNKKYGHIASFFPNYTNKRLGALAGEARAIYSSRLIERYEIKEVNRPASAVANARIEFCDSDELWTAEIRFCRLNEGVAAADWEQGEWKVMDYADAPFLDINSSTK